VTVQINQESANIPSITLTDQGSDIAAPSAGYVQFYTKSGAPYFRTSTGILVPIVNPMTTAADLIVGGTAGAPARLAKGSDGQVLTVDPATHLLVWATPATGAVATDPIWDAAGDLAVGSGADTAVRLAKGTNSQVLTVDPADTTVKWMTPADGGGDYTLLAQIELASDAASIDFQNISQAYRHLVLDLLLRTVVTQYTSIVNLRLNNDSGSNYDWIYADLRGDAYDPHSSFADTSARIGTCPGTYTPADYASTFRLTIPFYTLGVFFKTCHCQAAYFANNGANASGAQAANATWKAKTAVSRITIYNYQGDLLAGCAASLYGVG